MDRNPEITIADQIRAGLSGADLASKKTEEYIGKVRLDLTKYPGEDKYCDGEVEDRLLEIARNCGRMEYQKIIEESHSWPILYHLSPLRENIVEWLPIDRSMKVLEVGAGCGAITGALAKKAGSVSCCDLSLKRSRINAYRHMEYDNITIHVGNFTDVEADLDRDYDLICLIGVFEYAQAYVQSTDPYGDFLRMLKKHCKASGRIVIAIENKFGLKYWAGCREDHLGTFFSSIENYPDGGVVRTFTDKGLMNIASACGFRSRHMYYPYPDYKFMTDLYSDRRLPGRGELKNNIRNMDRDRYRLFNEKEAFDSILEEGLFHLYSNSYMLVLGPDIPVDYARYSNDRLDEFSICTTIETVKDAEGTHRIVKKRALSEAAAGHIAKYSENCRKLKERYAGSGLTINEAVLSADGMEVSLDYVTGKTLEDMLDERLACNDSEGFMKLYGEYLERIGYGENNAKISDLDLIFSNILIDGDIWNVIDYEWTADRAVSTSELGFRALYCYILEDDKRDSLGLDSVLDLLGITPAMAQDYREQEMSFQKSVTGNHKSLGEIREAIGNPVYTLEHADGAGQKTDFSLRPQIYWDTGRGFNEEQSVFTDAFPCRVHIPDGAKTVRIDPCSTSCIAAIRDISVDGQSISRGFMNFKNNGRKCGSDVFVFETSDPGFTLSLKGIGIRADSELEIDMDITPVDTSVAKRMG